MPPYVLVITVCRLESPDVSTYGVIVYISTGIPSGIGLAGRTY